MAEKCIEMFTWHTRTHSKPLGGKRSDTERYTSRETFESKFRNYHEIRLLPQHVALSRVRHTARKG